MKKLLKCIPVILAAAAFLLFIPSNTVDVQAAGKTYYIMYREDAKEWRYVEGNVWLDEYGIGRELYYLTLDIEDGDSVIICGYDPEGGLTDLTLSASLANLTMQAAGNILVKVNSVENCYVNYNSSLSLTGDVTNAYIYNASAATFYGNISYMEIRQSEDSEIAPNVSSFGAVGHLAIFNEYGQQTCDIYNIDAGTLMIVDGTVETPSTHYSTSSSSVSAAASAEAAAVAAATQTASASSADTTTASGSTYTVVKGDNLWNIALKYLGNGMRYPEIKSLSGLSSDTIYAGQVLTLPAN